MTNPYSSPQQRGVPKSSRPQKPSAVVMAPAIALIVVATLGLGFSLFNIFAALTWDAPPIDPNAPPFVQQMEANQVGPVAAAIQSCFAFLNIVIMLGAIQMLRFKMWGVSLTVSILAMLNFGTCCCILGLPVGIWSIVVLSQPHVKKAFD